MAQVQPQTAAQKAGLSEADFSLSQDPNAALAQVTNTLDKRKRDFFWGIEDSLIASVNDTSIVDKARQTTARQAGVQAARSQRDLSRYGVIQTGAQTNENARRSRLASGLSSTSTVNNARLTQFDRNNAVQGQLLNNSRALTGQVIDGLSSASSLQTSREDANRARSSQDKADKIGTLGSLAALGIAFI